MAEWFQFYGIKYMGGHVEHPKPTNCRAYLYHDRLEIENPDLIITYDSITNIENMDDKKISAKRVVALGLIAFPLAIVGALWKKNHIYTVIEYKDQSDGKVIVLDFGDTVSDIQGWIFRKMLHSRNQTSSTVLFENGFMKYENKKYGFSIKFPEKWIKDEFDQKFQDYTTVVEFRMFLESKPPFVTIYVNDVPEYLSFHHFIEQEKKDLSDESGTSILEFANILIANEPAARLVYVEYEGYKRLVTWIQGNNKVYEISYTAEQTQFLEYVSIVENMVNSFQLLTVTMPIVHKENSQADSKEDPLVILKRRFARGEITEEQYERMSSILRDSGVG